MSWEERVKKVVPYVPGDQPKFKDMVKLNTNECPYPPAPGVERMLKEMSYEDFRLYPAPGADDLVESLADYYKVKPSQVFVGVGSDDVIAMAFLTFFSSGEKIFFPDITYSFYPVWAQVYGIPYETKALDKDFHIKASDYTYANGGVIFPNPNAPTGLLEPLSVVEEIIRVNKDSVVIVDEAYIDFADEGSSALPLIDRYENLLVVRTFSKSRAMAGMRIGYAIGNERLIKYLNDVKFSVNSYTMNRPSLLLGVEAVKDDAYFKETLSKIRATRERMKQELVQIGFSFPDAQSNFIFATHRSLPASEIYGALKEKHIFVRYFNTPGIDNYLRITVGTEDEADILIDALKEILKERNSL